MHDKNDIIDTLKKKIAIAREELNLVDDLIQVKSLINSSHDSRVKRNLAILIMAIRGLDTALSSIISSTKTCEASLDRARRRADAISFDDAIKRKRNRETM